MPTSIDFLKRVSMFEDLDQRSLEAIANAAVEQRYETGQEIVRQGDTGVGAFIIRSGKVDIVQDRDGREQKIATLGPGDVFGEMALLDEFPRSATARAVEPVREQPHTQRYAQRFGYRRDSPRCSNIIRRSSGE